MSFRFTKKFTHELFLQSLQTTNTTGSISLLLSLFLLSFWLLSDLCPVLLAATYGLSSVLAFLGGPSSSSAPWWSVTPSTGRWRPSTAVSRDAFMRSNLCIPSFNSRLSRLFCILVTLTHLFSSSSMTVFPLYSSFLSLSPPGCQSTSWLSLRTPTGRRCCLAVWPKRGTLWASFVGVSWQIAQPGHTLHTRTSPGFTSAQ